MTTLFHSPSFVVGVTRDGATSYVADDALMTWTPDAKLATRFDANVAAALVTTLKSVKLLAFFTN